MFLRSTFRKKDGKEHEYFSIVENKRVAAGKGKGSERGQFLLLTTLVDSETLSCMARKLRVE